MWLLDSFCPLANTPTRQRNLSHLLYPKEGEVRRIAWGCFSVFMLASMKFFSFWLLPCIYTRRSSAGFKHFADVTGMWSLWGRRWDLKKHAPLKVSNKSKTNFTLNFFSKYYQFWAFEFVILIKTAPKNRGKIVFVF